MREMKDSGVPWIGEIPKNWRILRGKNILTLLERPVKADDGVITCFRDGEVTLRSNRREEGFTFSLQEIGYQGVEPGDLVVHGMDGFAGSIGISDSRGKATPVLNVMDSSESKKYLMYQLRTMAHCGLLFALSSGIRVRSCDTNWNKLKTISYLVPPKEEQLRIVSSIDVKCTEIDSIIESTRASIEDYKKLKQSVITEAVTKGIRGKRPLKDSGVEWIGEIPAEWGISRVGLHHRIILGKMLCSEPVDGSYSLEKYLCAADVHFTGVSLESLKTMWFSPTEKAQYKVCSGDLLVVEGGAGAGGAAIVTNLSEDVFIQNSIMIVRPLNQNSCIYVKYLLESLVGRGYVDYACNKATIPHFTKDKLGQVPLPLPSPAEQLEIAAYLDEKCAAIDSLIASKEALITELEAYKKSLIYEYVTGKKEVL